MVVPPVAALGCDLPEGFMPRPLRFALLAFALTACRHTSAINKRYDERAAQIELHFKQERLRALQKDDGSPTYGYRAEELDWMMRAALDDNERLRAAALDQDARGAPSRRPAPYSAGCTSDFSCRTGFVCVKIEGYPTGRCQRSVNSFGTPQSELPRPNSDAPQRNDSTDCRTTGCPVGFRCDQRGGACVLR